jgi:uncharacterized protein YndB with AHSA1/START domain
MAMQIGLLNVRRSILIQAAPARVWEEFTSFERIAGWLNLGHTIHVFEPRLGGNVRMSVELDGVRQHYGGPILTFEPGRELSFESNWEKPPLTWPVPTLWTIRLTPLYDGTLVELFHHGFERLGAGAADNLEDYESGWDVKHLKALRAIVGG